MTETLTRLTPEAISSETVSLEDLLDSSSEAESNAGTETTTLESEDNREVSQFGSRVEAASERVASFIQSGGNSISGYFKKRAINRAYGEALTEDASRTLEAQQNARDEAFDSYAENFDRAADIDEAYSMNDEFDKEAAQQKRADIDEAYSINNKLDKEAAQQRRAEKIENAKERVGQFGRAALTHLKNTGLVAFGAGVLAAEAGSRAAGRGVEATRDALAPAAEYTKSAWIDSKRKAEERKAERVIARDEIRREREEAAKNDRLEREKAKQERLDSRIEKASQKALLAVAKKAERRLKWGERKDKTIDLYKDARNLAASQKAGIGKFARRVQATTVAATTAAHAAGKEAWATN